MRIETNQDLQTAIARLASRTPETLATFIASLAFDIGPIGAQKRTVDLRRVCSCHCGSSRCDARFLGDDIGKSKRDFDDALGPCAPRLQ
jgi:hypothetical protein